MGKKAGTSLGEAWVSSPRSEQIHAALHWATASVIRVKLTQPKDFRSLSPSARHCPKSTSSSVGSQLLHAASGLKSKMDLNTRRQVPALDVCATQAIN